MTPLLQVKLFADEWHRGKWRARDLPDAIGADVRWARGGSKILGFAVATDCHRGILLNSRIRGTALEQPLLFHEAAHIIQGDVLGFCGNAWVERQCERNAVDGSALLAIPTAAAIAMVDRRATVPELAEHYEVPRALVQMRASLAVLLGEAPGSTSSARRSLGAARASLGRWMERVSRDI